MERVLERAAWVKQRSEHERTTVQHDKATRSEMTALFGNELRVSSFERANQGKTAARETAG
ncbi:hypothetical protein [Ruegeria sp. 6PALISEP08]|uniref:hypothetical protein n=1 Tax=Ruegeria sp. 6PALISEP08 TaxID=1225660 RepID=UPI00067EFDF0|nr:hypothetical protein [Ruegeria sp. 6PALISEP08]